MSTAQPVPEQSKAVRPAHQFQPGVSGNPSGKAKLPAEAREARRLARITRTRVVADVQAELGRMVGVAIDKLIELVDSKDENVALRAADSLLSRVNGQPVAMTLMQTRMQVDDGRPAVIPIADVARHLISLRRDFEEIGRKQLAEAEVAR